MKLPILLDEWKIFIACIIKQEDMAYYTRLQCTTPNVAVICLVAASLYVPQCNDS